MSTTRTVNLPFEVTEHEDGKFTVKWPGGDETMALAGDDYMHAANRDAIDSYLASKDDPDADTWHWTNDDHTEARKGRWTTRRVYGESWSISHDDIPNGIYFPMHMNDTTDRNSSFVKAVDANHSNFLAWKAEQEQPEEPEGFGYVGTITGEHGLLDVMRGDGSRPDLYYAIARADGCHFGQMTWDSLLALGTFEAVAR